MKDVKEIVKEKYGQIAQQSKSQNETSCCGAGGCGSGVDYTIFSENYTKLEGYNPDADLGLGCGIPTEFAQIKKGDTVVDLGSGAGNDCFVARALTGDSGKVIGIDMTEAMIEKARVNAEKLGFNNVEFRLGDIEKMPLSANKADVIVSNCVLYRVLKPGGHLSVSDVVIRGQLPEAIKEAAEMYVGCVSGALPIEEYLQIMRDAGLENIKVNKEKVISVPDEIMLNYLDTNQLAALKNAGTNILSITVYAEKPLVMSCGCGCGCN